MPKLCITQTVRKLPSGELEQHGVFDFQIIDLARQLPVGLYRVLRFNPRVKAHHGRVMWDRELRIREWRRIKRLARRHFRIRVGTIPHHFVFVSECSHCNQYAEQCTCSVSH